MFNVKPALCLCLLWFLSLHLKYFSQRRPAAIMHMNPALEEIGIKHLISHSFQALSNQWNFKLTIKALFLLLRFLKGHPYSWLTEKKTLFCLNINL